jgi:hypothetical protein
MIVSLARAIERPYRPSLDHIDFGDEKLDR